jgi:hypothetical protein
MDTKGNPDRKDLEQPEVKKLKLQDLKVRTFLTDEEAEAVWGGSTDDGGGGVVIGRTYTAAPPHCPQC